MTKDNIATGKGEREYFDEIVSTLKAYMKPGMEEDLQAAIADLYKFREAAIQQRIADFCRELLSKQEKVVRYNEVDDLLRVVREAVPSQVITDYLKGKS